MLGTGSRAQCGPRKFSEPDATSGPRTEVFHRLGDFLWHRLGSTVDILGTWTGGVSHPQVSSLSRHDDLPPKGSYTMFNPQPLVLPPKLTFIMDWGTFSIWDCQTCHPYPWTGGLSPTFSHPNDPSSASAGRHPWSPPPLPSSQHLPQPPQAVLTPCHGPKGSIQRIM